MEQKITTSTLLRRSITVWVQLIWKNPKFGISGVLGEIVISYTSQLRFHALLITYTVFESTKDFRLLFILLTLILVLRLTGLTVTIIKTLMDWLIIRLFCTASFPVVFWFYDLFIWKNKNDSLHMYYVLLTFDSWVVIGQSSVTKHICRKIEQRGRYRADVFHTVLCQVTVSWVWDFVRNWNFIILFNVMNVWIDLFTGQIIVF